MSKIVRGTLLLTGATFLSKFLGMIYVVPFNSLVGVKGGTLFNTAYIPYSIFLSFSTVGVPLAVSKFVSKYNSLGDYRTGMRMFRAGMILMFIMGVICFSVMFFSAEWLAGLFISGKDAKIVTVSDVTLVIRLVSFALLIIPSMSIVRGFFQGYESMGPTAVSQVTEQIVRIFFILAGSVVILYVLDGSVVSAVGFSTFSAFIGAVASGIVLFIYWTKRKANIEQKIEQQTVSHHVPLKHLFQELFRYAGPFVLVGLATSLYQLVDLITFDRAMLQAGYREEIRVMTYAAFNFYGHKLVIIPGTIAIGLSLAIIPALTASFVQHKRQELIHQINQALQIILVIVIPAVCGLSILADVSYGSLFGLSDIDINGNILRWYAPVGLLFAMFTVTSSVLQGINEQRFAVISLSAGLLMKILFNTILIHSFGAIGAVIATGLASGTAVVLNMWRIRSAINFSFKQTFKRTALVLIFVLFMLIGVMIVKGLLGIFLDYTESRAAAIITLISCVLVGAGIYLWFAYQSTLLERTLGNRIRVLDRFFKKR
ncbi:MAG TPA: polysaccharide biosynthesis protein [Virgibacillus sp.]|nr:polysaccharide biosynthesis protein [Virgibacillus sp.]